MIDVSSNDENACHVEIRGNINKIRYMVNGRIEVYTNEFDKPHIIYLDGSVLHPPGLRCLDYS